MKMMEQDLQSKHHAFPSALQNRTGRCVRYLYRNPLCDERFVPVLPGWFADGCDGALLQYPVADFGDEKDRIVFRPEDDRHFLADLYIYRLIILFPYRSIGGERCLYRRLLRWSYFRIGCDLYFPGAKYEDRKSVV